MAHHTALHTFDLSTLIRGNLITKKESAKANTDILDWDGFQISEVFYILEDWRILAAGSKPLEHTVQAMMCWQRDKVSESRCKRTKRVYNEQTLIKIEDV